MNDSAPLAPIRRRARMDRGATGPANPPRIRSTVEVTVFDAEAHARGEHPFRRVECEVMMRALSPAVAGLPLPLQEAVQAYAKAVEEVEAGGASDPEAGGCAAAGGLKEGRQFHAVQRVELWRRLDRAIGAGAVTLGSVRIGHRDLLRAVAIDGLSVSQLLAALGLPRSRVYRLALLAGVIAAATALAVELGHIEPVEKNRPTRKNLLTARCAMVPVTRVVAISAPGGMGKPVEGCAMGA